MGLLLAEGSLSYTTGRGRALSGSLRLAGSAQLDPVEPGGVVAGNLARDLLRHAGEVPCDHLLRMRPGRVGMGKIGSPHVIVFAEELPGHRSDRIILESGKELAPDVLA